MKVILSILLSFSCLISFAQPLSGSFTDCNNNSRDIHTTLGTGKALIIAHKGVDCSICQSQASSLETWASQNSVKVEVWCALTWKYNSNTFSPACTATANWVSTYSWNNIFTFPDNARQFVSAGTPRYYVYSPRDSTIKYSGSNRSTAYSTALAESYVGLDPMNYKNEVNVRVFDSRLYADNLSLETYTLQLIDLSGRIILEEQLKSGFNSIDLSEFDKEIYLVHLRSESKAFTEKIFLN